MYYVIEIAIMKDGAVPKAIYGYDTVEGAVIHYHQSIASMMSDEQVSIVLAMILDEEGNVIQKERWVRSIRL